MPIDPDRLRTGGAFLGPLVQAVLPPAPVLPELLLGARVGAFRVERELSRGGMGIVYLATRVEGEFAQRVALKWMAAARDRAVAEAMFRRERDIVAGLEHPGIARLIDGGRTPEGMLWFAMELVEGARIDHWCEAQQATVPQRVRLVLALCDALAYAHDRLLIHRDVKPANVLVDVAGRVKLLDFGIARLADQQDLLGNFALTPGYASPEQWSGDEVTVRSDLYQVGLLLAALLGCTRGDIESGHATRTHTQVALGAGAPTALDPERLARLPRDLAAVLAKATALDPARRYSGIDALSDDLRCALQHRPVVARAGGVPYRVACFARRHPVGVALGVAVLVALGLLGWRLLVERDAAQREAARALAESTRAKSALEFLVELLRWAQPDVAQGESVTVDAALAHGVEQLGTRLADQPRLRGELLLTLGSIYLQRRDRERARPLLQEAYELLAADASVESSRLSQAALQLGSALSEAADRTRSLALLQQAMDLSAGVPAQRTDYLAAWRIKAIRHYQDGDLARALAENEAALRAPEVAGADALQVQRLRLDHAQNLREAGRNDEALQTLRTALQGMQRELGDMHPETSRVAFKLANALVEAGRYDEAGGLLAHEERVREKLWGRDHPEYGHWLQGNARFLQLTGRRDEALPQLHRAIAIAQAHPGLGRTQLASMYELEGMLLADAGDLAAAEAAYRRATDPALQGTSLNQDFGERRLRLAAVLIERGALIDAVAELDRVEAAISALADDHPRRTVLAYERARLAHARGDATQARAFIRDARQRERGAGKPGELRDAIEQLARQLEAGSGR